MARTTEQIYNAIVTELSTYNVLNGTVPVPEDFESFKNTVTSQSKVEPARHILYGVAYIIHTLEVIFDAFKTDVNELIESAEPFTERWMTLKTKAFQLGYALEWDGKKYSYASVDTSAQIIAQCAVITSGSDILIKVAKDQGGALVPCTASEKTALEAYWKVLRYPGMNFIVISEQPDDIRIELDVVYDPLVMNPDGTLRSDGSNPVDQAIQAYNQSLDFNGRFWVDDFIDAIQAAEGVIAPDLNVVQAKYGALPYADIDKFYDSFAGHLQLDNANTTINYITA